ncbi:hypothetical protein SBBP2_1780003 [Burkholderiales bacterium]|nr:hypothetical protein SBBP2_1780003 [Burkholderiales bacterium]
MAALRESWRSRPQEAGVIFTPHRFSAAPVKCWLLGPVAPYTILAASHQRSSYPVVCSTLENIDAPCSLSMIRRIAAGGLATKH